jgi:ABC-type polysaccharide transport system permease subunit
MEVLFVHLSFEADQRSEWSYYFNGTEGAAYIEQDGQMAMEYLAIKQDKEYRSIVTRTVKPLENGIYTLTALIDGAGHFRTLFSIYLPVSLPAIATLALFSVVFHWNSWFDGLLYIGDPKRYSLATYLQTVFIQCDMSWVSINPADLALISQKTVKSIRIFIGAFAILIVYLFLQKFFVKGFVMGSVKE